MDTVTLQELKRHLWEAAHKERFPDQQLLQLLNHLNKIDLGVKNVRVDDMSRAYEYQSVASRACGAEAAVKKIF
jgi:hypothetical protein